MTPLSPQKGDSAVHGAPAHWRSTSGENQVERPRSVNRWRMYHSTSAVVVTPGVMSRAEKASETTPRAMATMCA